MLSQNSNFFLIKYVYKIIKCSLKSLPFGLQISKRQKLMKFQFCGNINCPEWFIAQISVLTKITAVKIKLIFSQIIIHFLEGSDITPKVAKLLNGTGLDTYEMHSVIATLKFILENSITFNVNDLTLNKELIDLGLPKENVQSITKSYKSSKDKLSQKASEKVLKITGAVSLKYSIHELLASSKTGPIKALNIPSKPLFAEISLSHQNKILNSEETDDFLIASNELDYLIYELEKGLQTMERLQNKRNKEEQQI